MYVREYIYIQKRGVHLHDEQRLNEGPGWRALTSGFWHPATPETGPSFSFLSSVFLFFFFLFLFLLFSLRRVYAYILVVRRPRKLTRTRGRTNAVNYLHLENA